MCARRWCTAWVVHCVCVWRVWCVRDETVGEPLDDLDGEGEGGAVGPEDEVLVRADGVVVVDHEEHEVAVPADTHGAWRVSSALRGSARCVECTVCLSAATQQGAHADAAQSSTAQAHTQARAHARAHALHISAAGSRELEASSHMLADWTASAMRQ